MAKPLAILMYHRISSERCPVPGDDREEMRYAVDLRTFERQVGAMKALGLRGVALGDALDVVAGRASDDSAVVITFDDGNRSDFEHALPVLRAAGYGATFFVSLNRVGRDDGLDESMIRALASDGFEVGSHGVSHRFLSTLDEREQTVECTQSKDALSSIAGQPIRFFAPPGGRYNETTQRVLHAAGYEAVCTSRFGYNRAGADVFTLKRIPIMRSTGDAAYRAILERSKLTLMPAYLRTGTLALVRRVIGEQAYRRVRASIFGE